MSDAEPTPPPTGPAEAPAAGSTSAADSTPVYEEYLASGARFRRWNLVSLILGLLCLAVGVWVVHQQQRAAPRPTKPPAAQEPQ